jgi:ribosomal protein L19E
MPGNHQPTDKQTGGQQVPIMTLVELSVEYRTSAAALQARIGQLEQQGQQEADMGEQLLLADRIRILRGILRETRELAVLCERYYERGYRRNAKYTL